MVEGHDAVMAFVLAAWRDAAEQVCDLWNLGNSRVDAREGVGGVVDDDGDRELVRLGRGELLGIHRAAAGESTAGLRAAGRAAGTAVAVRALRRTAMASQISQTLHRT
jgi:hypothetical protein